ncbi:PREDICTED: uncharacterized protein LOC105568024 [Vollenhovia emeryi]|uniref:uncharacterized protein LOC105568024 n=1 Tax=Vollenhovia emeryi TaxID=411798 RepID=UPI0005F43DAA|nr:PREDICTED: uncharacterized protein LOC105568024 [Vollenhovia emeryi]
MTEQWSISENNTQLEDVEKGLYRENHKVIRRIEYKTNCCLRCIPYLRLIFLLEVTLFFGWGCYMIFQFYRPEEMKNETDSILEKNSLMIESLLKTQTSSTDMPEIIIDEINNPLKDIEFTKDQNLIQNKKVVTSVPSMVQTNAQNSNDVQSNNVAEISDVDRILARLGNLVHDEKITKIPVPRFSLAEYIDGDLIKIDTDKNEKSLRHEQVFEKLRNINKIKATNDIEKFEGMNEDGNGLMLESEENHVPDASNELENSELNVATISSPQKFVDHTISEFVDLTEDAAQDNRNENSFLIDENDRPIKIFLEPGLVIYPPYKSHKFSNTLVKDSTKELTLAPEISEQIENRSNGSIDESNVDNHDMDDSDMSAFEFGNQDYSDILSTVKNVQEQYPSESIVKEDEKYESTENVENSDKLWLLQPTVQDSVESSTTNVDQFQWFMAPPPFVDLGLEDISKSSEKHDSLSRDTSEDVSVDDVIRGSKCKITIKLGILKVICPAIKFDEEWSITSTEMPVTDVPKTTNFEDILRTEYDEDANKKIDVENISNENVDKEVTTLRDSISKVIDALGLQESVTSGKISNDALLDSYDEYIDPFEIEAITQDYVIYDSLFNNSNEKDVEPDATISFSVSDFNSGTTNSTKEWNLFLNFFDTQQQMQLKSNKEQDHSDPYNTHTSLIDPEYFYLLEKSLIALLKNEMSDSMTRDLPRDFHESSYWNNFCSIHHVHSAFQHHLCEQYVAVRNILERMPNSNYPHSIADSSFRKKRMTNDLAWQQGQVSNTLEEDDKDAVLSENLRKLFQKMEVLAFCIDRLHERYLLHNKLDDDYASSEFPMETEERRKLYTSQILYEKY